MSNVSLGFQAFFTYSSRLMRCLPPMQPMRRFSAGGNLPLAYFNPLLRNSQHQNCRPRSGSGQALSGNDSATYVYVADISLARTFWPAQKSRHSSLQKPARKRKRPESFSTIVYEIVQNNMCGNHFYKLKGERSERLVFKFRD